jgi:hypothetical protein
MDKTRIYSSSNSGHIYLSTVTLFRRRRRRRRRFYFFLKNFFYDEWLTFPAIAEDAANAGGV